MYNVRYSRDNWSRACQLLVTKQRKVARCVFSALYVYVCGTAGHTHLSSVVRLFTGIGQWKGFVIGKRLLKGLLITSVGKLIKKLVSSSMPLRSKIYCIKIYYCWYQVLINFKLNPKYNTLVQVHHLRTIKILKRCIEIFYQIIHDGEIPHQTTWSPRSVVTTDRDVV